MAEICMDEHKSILGKKHENEGYENNWKQAQHRAAAARSQHKRYNGNSVPGAVFSHPMPKMDVYYYHLFSWEKAHKIDISHAMVISI